MAGEKIETLTTPSIGAMFSSIAHRYDLLNHILSLGLDYGWRKRAAKRIKVQGKGRVLDLACGTGDMIRIALKGNPYIRQVAGADISYEMLKLARRKVKGLPVHLLLARAEELPFKDGSFSSITVAFGLRNFEDRLRALAEMHRVLEEGGRAVILEFSRPQNRLFRAIYRFYLYRILPKVAGLFSREEAYIYLSLSIGKFPRPEEVGHLLGMAGFKGVSLRPLTWGTVTLYRGSK